ncbi:DUF2652 domain-containing protein [Cyclobacterium sp. 1_MG-2023]|uniref:DUF2652 domain-containing protein n=1 Tax=Cyclobacterium sp. 1_MG-2023 TaxID=3062681 RepID=UPI0026E1560D|nr:DUF2652 domain-containing protein [Cyclobacterium sp. 1_MG-2023]MDO6436201.1 DUF2652 domain-containing protein [Cyclobacterium sp. 1_MG-2023]
MHVISPITDSNKGVIFIPDISGFTQFIKKTEISHSQHIITELLELIIKETGKEFSLSEIEGDALLFYNSDSNPDFEKLTLLCISIFKKFHQHLKYYGRDRICQCGACSSTENLSLKFILHAGTITQYNVGGHHKLLGEDIIVAHRFLKNSIDRSEYILFSENFIKASNPNDQQIATLNSCDEKFESLEPTVFYYRPLQTFKENIVAPPARNSIEFPTIKPGKMVDINADPNELLLMLAEPQHRIKWMKSLTNITLRDHKINRILSVHECLIGSNQIEVSIEDVTTSDLGINFFERARMKHPQLDFLVLYHLEKIDDETTRIGIGNHFFKSKYWATNIFLLPVLSFMFRYLNQINLRRLKKYAEKELL